MLVEGIVRSIIKDIEYKLVFDSNLVHRINFNFFYIKFCSGNYKLFSNNTEVTKEFLEELKKVNLILKKLNKSYKRVWNAKKINKK